MSNFGEVALVQPIFYVVQKERYVLHIIRPTCIISSNQQPTENSFQPKQNISAYTILHRHTHAINKFLEYNMNIQVHRPAAYNHVCVFFEDGTCSTCKGHMVIFLA